MITKQIKELENLIDKEIDGYKNIEKLYTDKKEILIKGKATDLYDVDAKIINTYKTISDLSEARKNVTKSLDIPTFSITDIINKIKNTDEQTAKKFEQKKAEVNELAKRIYKLEKINIELTKHGLLLTGKTIEAMLKGVTTVNNEYNAKGQNITDDRLKMSSIVEEA